MRRNINLFVGYFFAVLLHGFYDACAMMGNVLSTVIFGGFVLVMYIVVITLIKKEANSDRPV